MNSNKIVCCPNCNAEYLPCEIYMPNDFLGKSRNIDKDFEGKVTFYDGGEMQLEETYCCDFCNKPFTVVAKVSFNALPDTLHDFSEDYVSKKQKASLFMNEE